jgi:hypothetical protein
MLDGGAYRIILAARQALIDTIERYPVPRLDPRALRMVAISGLFADSVTGLATSPQAPKLVAVIKQQLAGAGLQLVPVARN